MGLTQAPATEAIMGAVPVNKAGIGSAVNDATRLFGGTLGVAVVGSVAASLYSSRLAATLPGSLPGHAAAAAHGSVGGAVTAGRAHRPRRLARPRGNPRFPAQLRGRMPRGLRGRRRRRPAGRVTSPRQAARATGPGAAAGGDAFVVIPLTAAPRQAPSIKARRLTGT